MMRYIIIALILVLVTAFPITAKEENISLGPYDVTFDLNITENYIVNISEPKHSETLGGIPLTQYAATVGSDNYLACIAVSHYDEPFDTNNETDVKHSLKFLSEWCDDPDAITYNRKIDGHDGFLSHTSNCGFQFARDPQHRDVFFANYWVDEADNFGNTTCMIISSFPWDEGTLSLLKTIHVEEST